MTEQSTQSCSFKDFVSEDFNYGDIQQRVKVRRIRPEEDQETAQTRPGPGAGPGDSKKAQARSMYRSLSTAGKPRKEIIAQFTQTLGLTPSSATAYYERIAKEFGETQQQGGPQAGAGMIPMGMGAPGMGMPGAPGGPMAGTQGDTADGEMGEEQPELQQWEDPDRQGVIRRVDNAHLVFKRQTDNGSFEELWIYKEGEKFDDELNVRRDILAGTDIPVEKTKSEDGRQRAEVWSSGNIQFLSITGLPN